MKRLQVLFLVLMLAVMLPSSYSSDVRTDIPARQVIAQEDVLISGVPYVWQEINGFCAWAATSSVMQYHGADITLHDLFALSGIGFSFAYIRYNDTLLMFPGALYQQIDPANVACELVGLNYSVYFNSGIEGIDQQVSLLRSWGIDAGLLDGESEAFSFMKSSIDEGNPLIVSVDPLWLPAEDYNFLRENDLSGGGHAIIIAGYNDTSGRATILDPGVGSFGDNFGYPVDGRGNYTEISYANLNLAWSSREYISILIKPGGSTPERLSEQLGPYIRDCLLGVGDVYAPGSPSAYLWNFGEKGFRALARDITPDGLSAYLSVFDGMTNEISFKASLLKFISLGLGSEVTLQYLAYRAALQNVARFFPDTDISAFLNKADDALPHFEALSENKTLVQIGNLSIHDSLISSTFGGLADLFNSSGDLEGVLETYRTELEQISYHLLGIADAWLDAGNALAEVWPSNPLIVYGPFLVFAVLGVAAVVITVVYFIRRSDSQ